MVQMNNVVLFDDGEIELKVSLENETVWLTRLQMSELFGRDVKTIGKHINNLYKEKELDKNATVANFAIVQLEGGREVERNIEHYNLDVIISVGYRVKSQRGVRFRQWATSVLKQYIANGYSINSEKITHQRFKELENDVALLKSKVNLLEDKTLKPSQGIFFDGQVFDAYAFVADLIKSAKREIILIDNYIDESVLTLFSKNQAVDVTIYTQSISKQLKLDLKKYNAQYRPSTIKVFKDAHDRFMLIDGVELYHIGASLKDLGKKWFAFSRMEMGSLEILGRLG
jgi:hypothetical protein